jgi:polygalacturonase
MKKIALFPFGEHLRWVLLLISVLPFFSSFAMAQHGICNVRSYGAKGDGNAKDTKAIQSAIDDCAQKGGGNVVLSNGSFLSGPIVLKSNITLEIQKDSKLLGSTDHGDYPEVQQFKRVSRQSLISALDAENLTITGEGVIDGQGQSWWQLAHAGTAKGVFEGNIPRPRGIVFDHCRHIVLRDFTLQNSGYWQLVPYYSDDITISHLRILAPANAPNTDAIDPFSSSNVHIDNVFDTGDDNVAIKSGQPGSPGGDKPSRNILVTDCVFVHGHGLSVGSEIAGGVQDIRAERISFKDTDNGIRIKSNRDRGNDIGNFVFRDIKMEGVKTPILISEYYPRIPEGDDPAQPVTRLTPHFHDITIENLQAVGSQSGGIIIGLPESPIKGVVLKNVDISAQKGMTISNAQVSGEKVTIYPETGKAILEMANAKLSLR